jgi:hypothetical protein
MDNNLSTLYNEMSHTKSSLSLRARQRKNGLHHVHIFHAPDIALSHLTADAHVMRPNLSTEY